jgi:uncharacterized protein YqjF (DUF2071 family)
MDHPSFQHTAHRPWPLPSEPWVGRQTWNDLLFLHWPVSAEALRPRVPVELQVQELQGTAWVSVTPFWMSDVSVRNLPAVPGISTFPELNVRTYVNRDDRPGVWFFSLDADNFLAVRAARAVYHLPYMDAQMSVSQKDDGIHYVSQRSSGVKFEAEYEPTGPVAPAAPGTPEHWLTERYCLYARSGSGTLYRAEIHHEPWPLQPARVRIIHSDMLAVHGLEVQGPPVHVQYSRRLEVAIWPPARVVR